MKARPVRQTGTTDTTTKRLMHREERRAQILGTAAGAFVAKGHDATSIDDVAAAAGVTKVIVYRHFEGKTELYRAILDEVTALLAREHLRLDAEGVATPSLRSLLAAARARPDAFRLLTVHAAREPAFAGYAELVRDAMEGAARSLVDPLVRDRVLSGWIVALLVDAAIAAVLEWLDHGDATRDEEFVVRTTTGLQALVGASLEGVAH